MDRLFLLLPFICALCHAFPIHADTLKLADGTVLTGDVRQVGDSIIEIRSNDKVRFISIALVHPDDRARFENREAPPAAPEDSPGTPPEEAAAENGSPSGAPPDTAADPGHRPEEGSAFVQALCREAFSTEAELAAREEAAETLHRLGYDGPVQPLIDQLSTADDTVSVRALRVMSRMPSPRMLGPVLERLGENHWQDEERVPIFGEILNRIGESAVPRIIEAARRADFRRGYLLIEVMGRLDDPRITDELVRLTVELDDGFAREEAFASLVRIGTPQAVEAVIEPLCRTVRDDTSENTDCIWAINLLGELGDERGVDPLLEALGREDRPSGSLYAVSEALARIGDRRAVRPLLAKLRCQNLEMPHLVAEALGEIGDPAALEPLLSLMVYLDADLRKTAAEAIGKIGDLRTSGVLIGYLDASEGDENTFEPLAGLAELGGRQVCRAIRERMQREPADGFTAFHGRKALDRIEAAGTADAAAPAGAITLWRLTCWFGFLGRWLVIAMVWFIPLFRFKRTEMLPAGQSPWFERFFLFTLAGLCVVRLLYVLVFHLNPGVLGLITHSGMPLARYVLCAVMDPLVVLLAVRGALKGRPRGWPLLLAYLPAAVLLGRYDYGYWTPVMIAGAGAAVLAPAVRLLAARSVRQKASATPRAADGPVERPRSVRPLLTLLVLINSARLIVVFAVSMSVLGFFMTWGWDQLSIVLGVLSGALAGVADAALIYLGNKLVLLLVCRRRMRRILVERIIDGVSWLALSGVCLIACGTVLVSAFQSTENMAGSAALAGIALLVITAAGYRPLRLVRSGREGEILRYFVIATILVHLSALPAALLWIS